jgi:hypothetical protein
VDAPRTAVESQSGARDELVICTKEATYRSTALPPTARRIEYLNESISIEPSRPRRCHCWVTAWRRAQLVRSLEQAQPRPQHDRRLPPPQPRAAARRDRFRPAALAIASCLRTARGTVPTERSAAMAARRGAVWCTTERPGSQAWQLWSDRAGGRRQRAPFLHGAAPAQLSSHRGGP